MKYHNILLKWLACIFLLLLAFDITAATDLPNALTGKTFLFHVANFLEKNNPNADISYVMHFNHKTYSYQTLNNYKVITGNYSYKVLDQRNGVALIHCNELYNGVKTSYTLLLNAADENSGLYIYKQAYGAIAPQQRMNFAYYVILDKRILTNQLSDK